LEPRWVFWQVAVSYCGCGYTPAWIAIGVPLTTINQSYTKKQRLEIAKDLRSIDKLDCNRWSSLLSPEAKGYVLRVLEQYRVITFCMYLARRKLSMDNYPLGGWCGYIHDALNLLADELEAVK
jgi:plasmid maintenance system killer protein